ncbi:MAG TPA: universal stress protein [Miltoncostaeaceae bacterium]|jgi:nucleotide-binding universal stress UspA family protein|nr:universal stress protein [Miltoncostaeaceae bacterium]
MAPSPERAPLWGHIACCLDESDASAEALREAARLRAHAGARLSVVHVAAGPPHDAAPPAPAWLTAAAVEAGGQAVLLVNLGLAASAVCEWAADARADLIVASAHRGVRERILLGSFAGHLARHAPCSVLLVRR